MIPVTAAGRRELFFALFLILLGLAEVAEARSRRWPNILVVTVDTLRDDRLSANGYARPTSPHIDALMRRSVRFTQTRTVEPLTAPALVSFWTSLHPHEHGATRNGLLMRPQVPSLLKALSTKGYRTAAFVGNWTLRDELVGLAEHFDTYEAVLNRKRWWFIRGEADASDLNEKALAWLQRHQEVAGHRPFFLWVHYVEPHAPYRYHKEFAKRLGIPDKNQSSASDRYDTEVAFVDRAIGELLDRVRSYSSFEETLTIFSSDHGESLGEHDYWGHGRHLYDVTLRVPMTMAWQGTLAPRSIDAPASTLDLTPTVLGLLRLPVADAFRGFDWSGYLHGEQALPPARVTHHQAHKGAVGQNHSDDARRQGLLEVGRVADGIKEVISLKARKPQRWLFRLSTDPQEEMSEVPLRSPATDELLQWFENVNSGLVESDSLPTGVLTDESIEQLRSLGYID